MGTEIRLTIAGVTLAYCKNDIGIDFGYLFQKNDCVYRKLDDHDYIPDEYWLGEHEGEEVFARKLNRLLPRLHLLNHSLETARQEYDAYRNEAVGNEIVSEVSDLTSFLSFEEFCELISKYPLSRLSSSFIEYTSGAMDRGIPDCFIADAEIFSRIPNCEINSSWYSEQSYFSDRVCILSAEAMLVIFASSAANLNSEVVWEYGPIVDNGYASPDQIKHGARRAQKVLIATEGASDSKIIKRALEVFYPDVADFFYFVDLDGPHHFWGASGLVKFAEGLKKIDIHNKVLFIFDNDVEGDLAYKKLSNIQLAPNLRAMLLPYIDKFENFLVRGPDGVGKANINGRAAAIECYLDLRLDGRKPAQVLWTNYKKEADAWHGSLEFKETYSKFFESQSDERLCSGKYDATNILILVDNILSESAKICVSN